MIEIIREEDYEPTKEKVLPKDIKQIGKPDIGDRIYVEDKVYRYLHPYDGQPEKTAYVLLGRFENLTGRQCVFIEGAIRLDEMDFEGELPQWNDSTWGYIYKKLKKDYDDMVIAGWAMDIKGLLPNLTARIEKLHQKHFGGNHQVLFLMDTLEREEAFYSNRNGHLYRRDGFYIYYGKSAPAIWDYQEEDAAGSQELSRETVLLSEPEPQAEKQQMDAEEKLYYEQSGWQEQEEVFDSEAAGYRTGEERLHRRRDFDGEEKKTREGNYRKQLVGEEEKASSFVPSLVMLALVCVLGFAAYQNQKKMNDMQETLARINAASVATEEKESQQTAEIKVEQVEGKVEKQDAPERMAESAENDISGAGNAGESIISDGMAGETGQDAAAAEREGTGQDAAAAEGNGTEQSTVTAEGSGTEQSAAEGEKTEQSAAAAEGEKTGQDVQGDTAATSADMQAYQQQGYYIVQKGDSLVSICRKIYQTTAMMDEICKINEIDDPNDIYAGQYLTLPE